MKTLVLQLARFGDIYQTWPTLRALKRNQWNGEIHLLVRDRFKEACKGLEDIDAVWSLDSQEILAPFFDDPLDQQEPLSRLTQFTRELQNQKFDRIINLSFSPLSSYLVSILSDEKTEVKGYTRYRDGFLAIPDDESAYFYAQVGPGRFNRVHLSEIFAAVAGVELCEQDWRPPSLPEKPLLFQTLDLGDNYLVIQIGASQSQKTFDVSKWNQAIGGICQSWSGKVVLIGSSSETEKSLRIEHQFSKDQIVNLVGKTKLLELFSLIQDAQLVLGGDSVAMHIGSLLGVRCLNLSFNFVNFWETGPLAAGSCVLWAETAEALPSDRVVQSALSLLNDQPMNPPLIQRNDQVFPSYDLKGFEEDDFCWRLISALYMECEFPRVKEPLVVDGLQRLRDLMELAMSQLPLLSDPKTVSMALEILGQVDTMVTSVGQMVPQLQPLTAWFETERIRIGPGPLNSIYMKTQALFQKLLLILQVMAKSSHHHSTSPSDVRLSGEENECRS